MYVSLRRLQAVRPSDRSRPHVAPGCCVRGVVAAGCGASRTTGGVAQAVAVLLGAGRRGRLDQGDGEAHVLARPWPRPHLCTPAR